MNKGFSSHENKSDYNARGIANSRSVPNFPEEQEDYEMFQDPNPLFSSNPEEMR